MLPRMNDNEKPALAAALDAVGSLPRPSDWLADALRWSALIDWLREDVRREGLANEP